MDSHFRIFKEAHNLYLAIALLFCLFFSIAIPPLWGFDESSHFARVYQVAEGNIVPQLNSNKTVGGQMPDQYNKLVLYSSSDIGKPNSAYILLRKDVDNISKYDSYTKKKFGAQLSTAINPATYSPFTYPLSELSVFIGRLSNASIGVSLFLARISGFITYIAITYGAISLLRRYKLRWLFFIIALSPVMIVQASVLSADTVLNALTLLFMASLIRLLNEPWSNTKGRPSKLLLLLITTSAVLMPLIKPNYIFLSACILLAPVGLYHRKKQNQALKIAVVLIASLSTVMWNALTRATVQQPEGVIIDSASQLSFLLHRPLSGIAVLLRSLLQDGDNYFIKEMFGVLGWNYVILPYALIFTFISVLMVTALYAKTEYAHLRKPIFISAAISLVGVISIFMSLYISFTPLANPYVEGVQGRYMLPFLIPIIMAVALLLPLKVTVKIPKNLIPVWTGALSFIILTVALLYYLLATY